MRAENKAAASIIFNFLTERLDAERARPLVAGLAGAQGSGKSTIAAAIEERLDAAGVGVARLSLDDFYLGRTKRLEIARNVHPLFSTRGAPGTHDMDLAMKTLGALKRGKATALPRFDKASDAQAAVKDWPSADANVDLVIIEGWCVGAKTETEETLRDPVNFLERAFDADMIWRRHSNDALKGAYADLFAMLDVFIFLAAPSFDVVRGWRVEQEHALAASGKSGAGLMSDAEIAWFIQHFERITRRMLKEAPACADLTLQLDEARRVTDVIRPLS